MTYITQPPKSEIFHPCKHVKPLSYYKPFNLAIPDMAQLRV